MHQIVLILVDVLKLGRILFVNILVSTIAMTITLKVLRACIRCNWIPLLGIEGLIVLTSRLLLLDTITNTSG